MEALQLLRPSMFVAAVAPGLGLEPLYDVPSNPGLALSSTVRWPEELSTRLHTHA